jgi:hypothetical protein
VSDQITTTPAPAAATPPHPSWCDPDQCRTSESDVHHSSEWGELETVDGRFTFALLRTDELAHPAEWGRPPELALGMQTSDSPITEATQVYLPVKEIPRLVAALAGEYYRATQAAETGRSGRCER